MSSIRTCKYWCMCQAACFPSLTDSTVVLVYPVRSPPQNTLGSLVDMDSGSISGTPQLLNFSGSIAFNTACEEWERVWGRRVWEEVRGKREKRR